MATLYNYLAGLSVDGNPLIWSFKPLTKSQIDASSRRPYVRVDELGENPTQPLYGNQDVIQQTVDILIYQSPTLNGTMPNRNDAMKLYFDIMDAVNNVDEWTYGQPLIAMHREVSLPPVYDEDSGGLAGMIRFRLLFPRG